MKRAFLLLISLVLFLVSSAQDWQLFGSGMNGELDAIVKAPVSGILYAGGAFTTAGGASAANIAQWDGNSWAPLGGGTNSVVGDLAIYNGELYAVGSFSSPGNHIAKWNGSSWSSVGGGVNSSAFALEVIGGELYVAGAFTVAGAVPANRIAKWDGTNWSALGTGVDDVVRTIGIYNAELYVGGEFTNAGGSGANHIAKWNGSAWSSLGTGADNAVWAIKEYDGELYAGGTFNSAGGVVTAVRIAKWNGSVWTAVGASVNNSVFALGVYDGNLYVGGFFDMIWATSTPAEKIAKWDGVSLSALGDGMNNGIFVMHNTNSALYVGGNFTTADGNSANNIVSLGKAVSVNPAIPIEYSTNIFPNPMTHGSTLQVSGLRETKNIKLSLMDAQGKLVRYQLSDSAEIYIERGDLSEGLYLYRLEFSNGESVSGKLLVSNTGL